MGAGTRSGSEARWTRFRGSYYHAFMNIAVLLSGGVDSSVALRMLHDAAEYELTAFYLKIWLEDELSYLGECPWEEDIAFARQVCEEIGVPLEIVPLQREYHDRVVSYTISELKSGRTPSPDIFCNQRIKFGAFVDAVSRSFDKIASGHYGRILEGPDGARLLKGVDPVKDQTYFLAHLSQEQVRRCLFPVGALMKTEVRDLAEKYDLPNRQRADSQGICFLGKIRFNDFVRHHLGEKLGKIVELETGTVLGEHRGVWFHTIGQRKGLGLSQGPWYVVRKDIEDNVVFVSHSNDLSVNSRETFDVTDPHWIHEPPRRGNLTTKLRHTEVVADCELIREADEQFSVRLSRPDPGIASGQFAVFYDEQECLGGARIV